MLLMEEFQVFPAEMFLGAEERKILYTALEDFEENRKNAKIFYMQFSSMDAEGNLTNFFREQGIEYSVRMGIDDLAGVHRKNAYKLASLEKSYPVMVKDIDYKNRIIFVSYEMAREVKRVELVEAIMQGFSEKKFIRTKARVGKVHMDSRGQSFLQLNLAGLGVRGYLFREDWSTCYTSDISGFAKQGDIIDVEITEIIAPKSYANGKELTQIPKNLIFRCSRKNTIDYNPWDGIDKKFPVGTMITIVCVSKTPHTFFAKIKGQEEINVLGFYPEDNKKENFYIRIGGCYQAKVKKVNEATKLLTVKPLKELV